jgi:hypothetical protein
MQMASSCARIVECRQEAEEVEVEKGKKRSIEIMMRTSFDAAVTFRKGSRILVLCRRLTTNCTFGTTRTSAKARRRCSRTSHLQILGQGNKNCWVIHRRPVSHSRLARDWWIISPMIPAYPRNHQVEPHRPPRARLDLDKH